MKSFRSKFSVHYKVGNDKYYIGSSTNLIFLPKFDVIKNLIIKTLLYMLDHFEYENRQNTDKDVGNFYNIQLQKTMQCLKNKKAT